jgi:lysophospholipase L1-like esterase
MNSLFIGDSITEGFPVHELLSGKHIINRGISGTSSGEILEYLSPQWLEDDPDQVFVCLGTNDIARDIDDDAILANLSGILDKVRSFSTKENVRFYLTSLFPTRDNAPRPNERINQLNIKIHRLAEKYQQSYLHLNIFFRDENNQLEKSVTDDGLHLNRQGYALWAQLIESLV